MSPTELVDLRIGEWSRVTRGANNRTHLLLKDGEETPMPDGLENIEKLIGVEADGEDELNEALKSRGLEAEARNAAVAAHRIVNGFADELDEDARREVLQRVLDAEVEESEPDDPLDKATEGDPEAREELRELRKIAEENRRTRLQKEYRDKADDVAGELPVDKDTLGQTLLALHEAGQQDEAEKIEDMFSALREQVETAELFRSAGRFDAEKSDAYSDLQKRAREMAAEKGISKNQALRRLADADPEAFEKAESELTA